MRNPAGESLFGLMQTLEESVEHPERLLVSFKIRAFRDLSSVPLSFGYTNREKSDAEDILSAGQEWEYKLWVITVDYPAQYSRSLFLDLTESLTAEGDWCELADLNILRLSSVSAFGDAAKPVWERSAALSIRYSAYWTVTGPIFRISTQHGMSTSPEH